MRRFALGGLLGVLALGLSSCIIVDGRSPVTSFVFLSDWERVADKALVVCSNRAPSEIGYEFGYSDIGRIVSMTETYEGFASKGVVTINRGLGSASVDSANKRIRAVIDWNTANNGSTLPQSVQSQAIVVTPTPVPPASNVGSTTLTVRVNLDTGSSVSRTYKFDVYANCPLQ